MSRLSREEREELFRSLANAVPKLDQLLEDYTDLEVSGITKQVIINSAMDHLDKLRAERGGLEAELAAAQGAHQKLLAEYVERGAVAASLDTELIDTHFRVDALEADLDGLTQEAQELRDNLRDSIARVGELTEAIETRDEMIARLEKSINDEAEEYVRTQQELEEERSVNRNLYTDLDSLQRSNLILNASLDERDNQIVKLVGELKRQEEALESRDVTIDQMQMDQDLDDRKITGQQEEIEELKETLRSEREVILKLEVEGVSMEDSIAEKDARLLQLSELLDASQTSEKFAIQDALEQGAKLAVALGRFHKEELLRNEFVELCDERAKRLAELFKEKDVLVEALDEARAQLSVQSDDLVRISAERQEFSDAYTLCADSRDAAELREEDHRRTAERTRAAADLIEDKNYLLTEENLALTDQIRDLKALNENLSASVDRVIGSHRSLKEKLEKIAELVKGENGPAAE